MSDKINIRKLMGGIIPRGTPGFIGWAVVAIAAFILGGLFFGGGGSQKPADNAARDDSEVSDSTPTTWTCSMHPQIQLPKPGKCPICFMDLIPLEKSYGDELDPRQLRLSETARQIARIETTPVRRAFADAEIRMVGRLDYDETKLVYITAWVPGRLDKMYADFTGITVETGEPMVYIYSPELLAAQEELIQAGKAVKALSASSLVLRNTAEAMLEVARGKLRLYGLTDSQIAEIETSGHVSDHLTVYAPVGGVVVEKHAREGMYVKIGTRIYTIADLTQLWAFFDAYESDVLWLREGQKVEFTTQSYPGEVFEGTIEFIDPFLNKSTRTVGVRAVVDNSDGRLKPDMFATGVITARLDASGRVVDNSDSGAEAPLLIPVSAPLLTGTRAVVYVEKSNDDGPIYEGREIVLGPRAGNFYVVKSGLQEGELVVTTGAFKIDAELQIQARPSMMLPEGGGRATAHQHGQPVAREEQTPAPQYTFGTAKRLAVTKAARESLSPLYNAYFKVQMALAADDLEATRQSYKNLADHIKQIDMALFEGDTHMSWMNISRELSAQAETGADSRNIESARDVFYHLSLAVIELHDFFGHAAEQEYYLTFCPMARNNKGAHWLQNIDTVYNPFYGESMLRCGEIQQTLSSVNN